MWSSRRRTTPSYDAVIDVCEVTRVYGHVVALDRLSLSVGAGEIHALLGRNGAGKTTLVRLLSGLVEPEHVLARHAKRVSVRGHS